MCMHLQPSSRHRSSRGRVRRRVLRRVRRHVHVRECRRVRACSRQRSTRSSEAASAALSLVDADAYDGNMLQTADYDILVILPYYLSLIY